MKLIALTQGKFAMVDDADFDWLNQWKWCITTLEVCHTTRHYAVRGTPKGDGKYKLIYMHRQIAATSEHPFVDHEDHDTLNNQRSNLRPCSSTQNCANSRKRKWFAGKKTSSTYKGVYWIKQTRMWGAMITVNKKRHWLGCYFEEHMAGLAYKLAAEKAFGRFAHS